MELNDLITQKVNTILDQKLDEILQKNVESTVEKIFSDLFSSWGDVTKTLKEQIASGLQINLGTAKIETYNERLLAIVHEQVGLFLDRSVSEKISERIREDFHYTTQKDWKLSDIIKSFVEQFFDEDDDVFTPTIIVEKSSWGSIHIYLDRDEGARTYDCEYSLDLNKEGKVYHSEVRSRIGSTNKKSFVPIGAFDQLWFALHANSCVVEIDEYETEFYKEDHYS